MIHLESVWNYEAHTVRTLLIILFISVWIISPDSFVCFATMTDAWLPANESLIQRIFESESYHI